MSRPLIQPPARPLIWLALDGVGHPQDAPPGSVWDTALPTLRPLVDAGLTLDAALGVPGLPQSGTGQACWLTGQDAVRLMGEHFGPQPGPTLRRLLDQWSLPVRLGRAGGRVALANFYPPAYFAAQAEQASRGRSRAGCFPHSVLSAGLPLNPPDLPPVPPTLGLNYTAPWQPQWPLDNLTRLGAELAQAARAGTYDLVMLDLWLSDAIGHSGAQPLPEPSLQAGREYLRRVDTLLAGALDAGAAAVISSDHGNLEDLSVRRHTRARVPLAWSGVPAPGRLTDVVQAGAWLADMWGLPAPPDL
ncbi:metalloenzyme domain protein [Deinococcus sp. Marseille-Q6407]|uniref:metalloenzyme domain protein n=1 Tax=Deinococcus sp. Marseille-Q6407 TaxID=2969223 RepID=UPI0021C18B35|nr:metalloenzyme domain protein [Deinococcus sp. Marseille-Q6407]